MIAVFRHASTCYINSEYHVSSDNWKSKFNHMCLSCYKIHYMRESKLHWNAIARPQGKAVIPCLWNWTSACICLRRHDLFGTIISYYKRRQFSSVNSLESWLQTEWTGGDVFRFLVRFFSNEWPMHHFIAHTTVIHVCAKTKIKEFKEEKLKTRQ